MRNVDLGQPDNSGSSEYCVNVMSIDTSILLNDLPCYTNINYICQPKVEVPVTKKVFQYDNMSVLGLSTGGCFSEAIKVKLVLPSHRTVLYKRLLF